MKAEIAQWPQARWSRDLVANDSSPNNFLSTFIPFVPDKLHQLGLTCANKARAYPGGAPLRGHDTQLCEIQNNDTQHNYK